MITWSDGSFDSNSFWNSREILTIATTAGGIGSRLQNYGKAVAIPYAKQPPDTSEKARLVDLKTLN